MAEAGESDTRSEILRVALSEFARRGYYATSLRVIAARVGISKTAVLYHFPEKSELLAALAKPMLDDLDAVIAAAEQQPDAHARWLVIEGLLEVELKYRQLLRASLRDLALSAAQPVFIRFRDAMLRANALVAGRGASFATRVRAAQALAMLGDPVVLFADAPVDQLRSEILVGVRSLLGESTRCRRRVAEVGPTQSMARPWSGRGAWSATATRSTTWPPHLVCPAPRCTVISAMIFRDTYEILIETGRGAFASRAVFSPCAGLSRHTSVASSVNSVSCSPAGAPIRETRSAIAG
jgi:AcrR family transcriptional regulator